MLVILTWLLVCNCWKEVHYKCSKQIVNWLEFWLVGDTPSSPLDCLPNIFFLFKNHQFYYLVAVVVVYSYHLYQAFFLIYFFSLQCTHVFCGRHLDRWPLINPTEPNPNQTKLIVNLNTRDPICRVRWLSSLANNINPFLKIIFFNSKKSTEKKLFTWLIPIFNRFIQIKNNNIKINMKKIIYENRLQLQ